MVKPVHVRTFKKTTYILRLGAVLAWVIILASSQLRALPPIPLLCPRLVPRDGFYRWQQWSWLFVPMAINDLASQQQFVVKHCGMICYRR